MLNETVIFMGVHEPTCNVRRGLSTGMKYACVGLFMDYTHNKSYTTGIYDAYKICLEFEIIEFALDLHFNFVCCRVATLKFGNLRF